MRGCLSFSSLQAVLLRAGPQQMQGVDIRVSDTPTPGSGSICKAGENFDPSQGKIVLCQPPLQASFLAEMCWAAAAAAAGAAAMHDRPPPPSFPLRACWRLLRCLPPFSRPH